MSDWRVGGKVPLNVYEGDKPMFQCHTPEEAARVAALLNSAASQAQALPCGHPKGCLMIFHEGKESCGWCEEHSIIRSLRKDRDEKAQALKEAEEKIHTLTKWVNCGGAPTGKQCSHNPKDIHDIYGSFRANADGSDAICEVHLLFKAEAERDRQYEYNAELIAKYAAMEAERDSLRTQLEVAQQLIEALRKGRNEDLAECQQELEVAQQKLHAFSDALGRIESIASGEEQVADDDTAALEVIRRITRTQPLVRSTDSETRSDESAAGIAQLKWDGHIFIPDAAHPLVCAKCGREKYRHSTSSALPKDVKLEPSGKIETKPTKILSPLASDGWE